MKFSDRGFIRAFLVLKLFFSIFWSFYSLKYRAWFHKRNWIENKKKELYVTKAIQFRETAIKLGGLLIKLGQFFSTRVDVLPNATIEELTLLQDEVKAVPFNELRVLAESELNKPLEDVFLYIDENPIASASLGQVHQVVLKNGKKAALKVQRPGIDALITIDLRTIKRVIRLLQRYTDWEKYIDLDAIFQEFSVTVRQELNYIQEGHNAEKIKANSQDNPRIRVPEIYWDYCSKKLLAMEFLEGYKINDIDAIVKANLSPRLIAQELLKIYIKQVLIDGFFHADPHPGNIFVDQSGCIIMVDFGMVGSISPQIRDDLVAMVIALVGRDFEKVVYYLKVIGFLRNSVDERLLIRAVSIFLEQMIGRVENISQIDTDLLLKDLEKLLYENPFQIPANFTFLGRALGTLYGICIKLHPDISFIDEAKPFIEQIAPKKSSIRKLIKDKSLLIGNSLIELPTLLERVLNKADRNDLLLNINFKDLESRIDSNTRALMMLSSIMGFGISITLSVFLLIHEFELYAKIGFGISLLFLLTYLRRAISHKKKKDLSNVNIWHHKR